MKLYCIYTLKALQDGQDKIKMFYLMSRVKKQLLKEGPLLAVEKY